MLERVSTRDHTSLGVRVLGTGKPVVLMHGFGMESHQWIPFILPLIGRYQFFLPDFRGFGQSATAPINNKCIITNFYEDLEDILDYFKLDQVALGGISMGALVSLCYLSRKKPDRIKKFLCIDQSPSFKHTDQYKFGMGLDNHDRWMSDIRNILTMLSQYQTEKNFFALPYDERSYAMMKFARFASISFKSNAAKFISQSLIRMPIVQNAFVPSNWQSYYTILKAYMENNYNFIDQVHQIDVQTTIFVGMLSEMYPVESSEFLAQEIKHSKLVRFEKSGHVVMTSEPVKFMIELNRFLSD